LVNITAVGEKWLAFFPLYLAGPVALNTRYPGIHPIVSMITRFMAVTRGLSWMASPTWERVEGAKTSSLMLDPATRRERYRSIERDGHMRHDSER
jgi:hypothetical protein